MDAAKWKAFSFFGSPQVAKRRTCDLFASVSICSSAKIATISWRLLASIVTVAIDRFKRFAVSDCVFLRNAKSEASLYRCQPRTGDYLTSPIYLRNNTLALGRAFFVITSFLMGASISQKIIISTLRLNRFAVSNIPIAICLFSVRIFFYGFTNTQNHLIIRSLLPFCHCLFFVCPREID